MHEVITAVLLIDVLELFFYSNFFDFPLSKEVEESICKITNICASAFYCDVEHACTMKMVLRN